MWGILSLPTAETDKLNSWTADYSQILGHRAPLTFAEVQKSEQKSRIFPHAGTKNPGP
jgi:hypothetical protein